MVTFATLISVMPAINALSERFFSHLRRIKSYLRSTMTQVGLNHCMILNAYVEELNGINLIDIAKDFVHNEHRKNIFWRILLIHITCIQLALHLVALFYNLF